MAKAASGKGSAFLNFLNLFKLLFTLKGTVSLTLIIILISSISAIAESIDQRSFKPFVRDVGGEILNHDNKLYIESVKIEQNGGLVIKSPEDEGGFFKGLKRLWETIKSLGRVLVNLWYLWTFAIIFYTLSVYLTNNESAKFSNTIMTAIFLCVLQVGANFLIIDGDILDMNGEDYQFTTKEKFMPFKGLFKFVDVAPMVFNPLYRPDSASGVNETEQAANSSEDSIINSIDMLRGDPL